MSQSNVDIPGAFVINDVCPDFSDYLRIAVTVQVVVLDLEVFAEW